MIKESEFKRRYQSLNSSQKKAVDTIEGPVMVVAGPGTGKTTILTLRIANILRKTDTPPSGILAITFTEAGVRSMRMKLREIIGTVADEVHIHTFHGFASMIIGEFPEHFVQLSGSRQISDIEAETLIRKILEDQNFVKIRPAGKPDMYVGEIVSSISESKREMNTPEKVAENAKKEIEFIQSDESSISTRGKSKGQIKADVKKKIERYQKTVLFSEVYAQYEEVKKKLGLIDYDDLLIELVEALKNDELLLRILQERFLYILVDEHQDTNDAQNTIVRVIADFFDSPNLFVVGDEKQAIFRFQGASVENFISFQEVWNSMKVIRLEKNYRSQQSILDSSFAMIEKNYSEGEFSDLRTRLQSSVDLLAEPVEIVSAEDVSSQDLYMVDRLKELVAEDDQQTIAIIVKTNRELEHVLGVLEQARISVSSEKSIDIFRHPAGSLFFDLLEFFNDQTRLDSLARTVSVGLWGLSFENSIKVLSKIKSGSLEDLASEIPEVELVRNELITDNALNFIFKLADLSGYQNIISKDPSSIEVWRGVLKLSESLIFDRNIRDPQNLISALLEYRRSAENRSVKIPVGSVEAKVKAMTAHSSKGLEFDRVFIPYATEQSWLSRGKNKYFILASHSKDGDKTKDARRLFYVALTRARRQAMVLWAEENIQGRSLTPLRFLDELDSAHIKQIRVEKSADQFSVLTKKAIKDDLNFNTLHDFVKRSIIERGLSVTALNNFLTCPNRFLYQSILRLPQAPSASAEKGNAMHLAFARIWASSKRSEENNIQILQKTINEYFERSFLPLNESKTAKKDLLDKSPVVASELAPHFLLEGRVKAESRIASEFRTDIKGEGEIVIPIHGNLDAIVEHKDKVLVFDYKTKKPMTENAIRGKTKNSTGNELRQLVFYTILVSDNLSFKDKNIETSLVFVTPDQKDRCPVVTIKIEKNEIEEIKNDIKSLIDSVWTGSLFNSYCDESDCSDCALRRASRL